MPNAARPPQIAVLGSINMDLVVRSAHLPRPGETVLADDAREVPGGKGANQAVAAARLGACVSMVGRVGTDAFGDTLLAGLQAEGIDTTLVQRSEGGSGLAVVAVEHSGENAILVVPGANGKVTPADVHAAGDCIRAADVLLIQFEIPLDAVLAGIGVARESGTRVLLDPAPAPARVPEGLLAADAICPNQSEAAALLGRPVATAADAIAAASALAQRGPRLVLVTLGADGVALCETAGTAKHIPSLVVEAVDSTAAGDAFAAGFAVRWAEGASVEQAVRFGCVVGGLAASRAGAQPSMPRREEVLARLEAGR